MLKKTIKIIQEVTEKFRKINMRQVVFGVPIKNCKDTRNLLHFNNDIHFISHFMCHC